MAHVGCVPARELKQGRRNVMRTKMIKHFLLNILRIYHGEEELYSEV
ncbi:MAG: hypothetical protein ACE5DW_02645 [Thermodesulfobacteriota bacterium]